MTLSRYSPLTRYNIGILGLMIWFGGELNSCERFLLPWIHMELRQGVFAMNNIKTYLPWQLSTMNISVTPKLLFQSKILYCISKMWKSKDSTSFVTCNSPLLYPIIFCTVPFLRGLSFCKYSNRWCHHTPILSSQIWLVHGSNHCFKYSTNKTIHQETWGIMALPKKLYWNDWCTHCLYYDVIMQKSVTFNNNFNSSFAGCLLALPKHANKCWDSMIVCLVYLRMDRSANWGGSFGPLSEKQKLHHLLNTGVCAWKSIPNISF